MEPTSRNNSSLYTPIAIVIAGVIVGGAVMYSNASRSGQVAAAGQAGQPAAPAVDIAKVKTEGNAFVGKADAPVTIAYWFDYQCPFCQKNDQEALASVIKDYVNAGKVRIVYKDFSFLGPDSDKLSQTARAVWDTDPAKFQAWHTAIFANQGRENSGWATDAKVLSITSSVLGAQEAQKVMQLVKTNGKKYQEEMNADRDEATSFGITGTPSGIIGKQLVQGAEAYPVWKAAIDAALAAK